MQYNIPQLLLDQKQRLEPDLKVIGDTWEDMLNVVGWVTSDGGIPSGGLIDIDWGKEILVWGETDGYRGLDNVSYLHEARKGLTLVISGGDYGREETLDNVGALDLFKELRRKLGEERTKERIIIESMSRNAGDQRRILGPLLISLAPTRIFIVLPKYHMPRFLMSIALPMYEKGFQPNIYQWPFGHWESPHALKGPLDNLDNPARTFTYEELLALPPTPSRFHGKLDCGEIDKIIQYAHPNERQCLTFRQARECLRI